MRRLYSENDIVIAEALRSGIWDRLHPPALAAAVSSVLYQGRREDEARQRLELHGPSGEVRRLELKPRIMGFDFPMLMQLAKQGIGVTLLPETICGEAVRSGELEVVLPEWRLPQGIFHAVFASRRGMLPAVRVFIDYLAEKAPALVETARLQCSEIHGRPCTEAEAGRGRLAEAVPA